MSSMLIITLKIKMIIMYIFLLNFKFDINNKTKNNTY